MNDRTFVKLFSRIVSSSMWSESSDTRVVWVTMLALCNQHGEVVSSVPGLSRLANVPLEATQNALNVFLSPDPHSRPDGHEGRRIEPVPGGWRLLNYGFYRNLMSIEERREYKRVKEAERRARGRGVDTRGQTVAERGQNGHIAEAEAEAEESKDFVRSGGAGEASVVTGGNGPVTVPCVTGVTKPAVAGRVLTLELTIPENLNSERFKDSWKTWVAFRKTLKRVKDWRTMFQGQLKFLSEFTPDIATGILDTSIRNGWQGLFPPKADPVNGTPLPAWRQDQLRDERKAQVTEQLRHMPAGPERQAKIAELETLNHQPA